MVYSAAPRLLIVADSPMQRIAIADAVSRSGFDVLHNIHSNRLKSEHCALSPTLWLLDVEDEDEVMDLLGYDAPLMLGISPAPPPINKAAYQKWVKSLSDKLNKLLGAAPPLLVFDEESSFDDVDPLSDVQSETKLTRYHPDNTSYITGRVAPNFQYVCVLAASMGGPEAVKRFLDHVPVTLPVAFILVQHIDPNMQSVLPRVLGRHNAWKFDTEKNFTPQEPDKELRVLPNLLLAKGHILVVPALRQIDFGDCGEVFAHAPSQPNTEKYTPWPGQYKPSINDVMRRAAEAFRSRLITIVFSGMGDDGSAAVSTVQETRGVIWAQSSGSCVCASQPDNVRASGQVSFNGTPEVLAEHLQLFIAEQSTSMS